MSTTATKGTVKVLRIVQPARRTAWGDSQHLSVLAFDPPLAGVGHVGAVSSIQAHHQGWTSHSHFVRGWDPQGEPWAHDDDGNPILLAHDGVESEAGYGGDSNPDTPPLRDWLAALGYRWER